jgi:uncharacterized protein (DUF302 family)
MDFNQQHSLTRVVTTLSEEETCRALRRALRTEGLELTEVADLSKEIERHIGLSPRKYIVLSIWSPLATYEPLLANPEAGLFVPLHLAVASQEGQTLMMVVDPDWLALTFDRIGFRLMAKDISTKLKRALAALNAARQEEVVAHTKVQFGGRARIGVTCCPRGGAWAAWRESGTPPWLRY